jgi:hypothetical protein
MKALCLFFGLVFAVGAQQAANTSKSAGPSKPAATPVAVSAKPQGTTVDGVMEMVQAGLSEDLIIASLRKENKAFDLSPTEMIRLKKANVSDNVLKVMLDPKAEIKPPAPAATTALPPAVIQTSIVGGLSVINPSGATPAPGTSATGNSNDPMTAHDSGIYLYTKDRDGKPDMVVLERAASQGAKTSTLGTALTYGIKKAKTRAVIPGPRASIMSTDGMPVFYFYFDDKAAGLGRSYFGATNVSNPNQFALLKLEVSKSNRETVIAEANVFGGSTGTSEKAMIGFKSERIRTGLYKVTMSRSLEQGEYCFLASAFGVGAAAAADLFDFGVSVQ